jgi:hypothetical protein
MNLKVMVVITAAALALGLFLGKTYFPRVEVKEVQHEVLRKDIVTQERTIVRQDGTKETIVTTTDKSVQKSDKSIVTEKTKPKDWHVSLGLERNSMTGPNVYGVQVERRVLGPFSIGVRINTEKSAGFVLGAEF